MRNKWSEWGNHVLAELRRLNDNIERIHAKNDAQDAAIASNREELAKMRVTAGVIGSAMGTAGALVVPIAKEFLRGFKS